MCALSQTKVLKFKRDLIEKYVKVLNWDAVAESWESAGNLTVPRQEKSKNNHHPIGPVLVVVVFRYRI